MPSGTATGWGCDVKKVRFFVSALVQVAVRRKSEMNGVYSGPYWVQSRC